MEGVGIEWRWEGRETGKDWVGWGVEVEKFGSALEVFERDGVKDLGRIIGD